jgi:hypothetical protein
MARHPQVTARTRAPRVAALPAARCSHACAGPVLLGRCSHACAARCGIARRSLVPCNCPPSPPSPPPPTFQRPEDFPFTPKAHLPGGGGNWYGTPALGPTAAPVAVGAATAGASVVGSGGTVPPPLAVGGGSGYDHSHGPLPSVKAALEGSPKRSSGAGVAAPASPTTIVRTTNDGVPVATGGVPHPAHASRTNTIDVANSMTGSDTGGGDAFAETVDAKSARGRGEGGAHLGALSPGHASFGGQAGSYGSLHAFTAASTGGASTPVLTAAPATTAVPSSPALGGSIVRNATPGALPVHVHSLSPIGSASGSTTNLATTMPAAMSVTSPRIAGGGGGAGGREAPPSPGPLLPAAGAGGVGLPPRPPTEAAGRASSTGASHGLGVFASTVESLLAVKHAAAAMAHGSQLVTMETGKEYGNLFYRRRLEPPYFAFSAPDAPPVELVHRFVDGIVHVVDPTRTAHAIAGAATPTLTRSDTLPATNPEVTRGDSLLSGWQGGLHHPHSGISVVTTAPAPAAAGAGGPVTGAVPSREYAEGMDTEMELALQVRCRGARVGRVWGTGCDAQLSVHAHPPSTPIRRPRPSALHAHPRPSTPTRRPRPSTVHSPQVEGATLFPVPSFAEYHKVRWHCRGGDGGGGVVPCVSPVCCVCARARRTTRSWCASSTRPW